MDMDTNLVTHIRLIRMMLTLDFDFTSSEVMVAKWFFTLLDIFPAKWTIQYMGMQLYN